MNAAAGAVVGVELAGAAHGVPLCAASEVNALLAEQFAAAERATAA